MVLRLNVLAVVVALAVPGMAQETAVPTDPQTFHLFLLAGQSNMAGRGVVEAQDTETNPRILSLDQSLQWVPAKDPLHFDKPTVVGVGLGRTFAQDYVKKHPGVTVGLIPCAVGGSPISAWQPGGYHSQTKSHPYDDALPRVQEAMKSGVLKGVLWHQGESDSNSAAAPVYEAKLHSLINRFRTQFRIPDLPFIAGQMGQFAERPWNESKQQVDAAHQNLPQKVSHTAFVSSGGLNHKGDKVHFDSAAYRELGHRYFAAYEKVLQNSRPNILFILADDVGREVLGCYGGESYQTPNIDALATGGQRYTHCYSMPVCHPSRITLLTGRYPVVLGHPGWGSFPRAEERQTMAAMLQRAGYATAVAGKWQLSLMKKDLQQPARMGFDQWSLFGWHEGPRYHDPLIYQNGELLSDTKGKYGPDMYVDFLIRFMEANRERPFFAYYSMALCHDVTDDLKEPVPYGPDGHWLTYAEMVTSMDHQVGRLVSALDEMQLRKNTLIVFTTDNGTAAASYFKHEDGRFVRPKVFSKINGREVQGGKGKLNDWGTRVPLIANWPGHVPAGRVRDDLVDFSDFLPTFAELGKADAPANVRLNGHSFTKSVFNTGTTTRSWAYAEARGGNQFVRTQKYKLYGNGAFFDMLNDPEEQSPLDLSTLSVSQRTAADQLTNALNAINSNSGNTAK